MIAKLKHKKFDDSVRFIPSVAINDAVGPNGRYWQVWCQTPDGVEGEMPLMTREEAERMRAALNDGYKAIGKPTRYHKIRWFVRSHYR